MNIVTKIKVAAEQEYLASLHLEINYKNVILHKSVQ